MSGHDSAVVLAGIELQNPLLLASGTAGYGFELAEVVDLERLGGLVTKAVSLEPRAGARSPRVTDVPAGMLNAVGLANPGVEEVRKTHLPWLAANLRRCRVLVNVVGFTVDEFAAVIRQLSGASGIAGFELNLSCPNVKAGGLEFGADPDSLRKVVELAKAETSLPLFVKLSPTLPDIAAAARASLDAGADGLTLVNTLPGLAIDVGARRPVLGFGSGGLSGDALLPVGLLATLKVWNATGGMAPIIGVGGIAHGADVVSYLMAGATAVAVGTTALRDPRAPERIVRELEVWMSREGVKTLSEVRGTLAWPV
ncbi:MAG: dihydroorotate dehydrogenase [Gemmatimonadota bacterium]